jgi:hypothetical protein
MLKAEQEQLRDRQNLVDQRNLAGNFAHLVPPLPLASASHNVGNAMLMP